MYKEQLEVLSLLEEKVSIPDQELVLSSKRRQALKTLIMCGAVDYMELFRITDEGRKLLASYKKLDTSYNSL